MDSMLVMELELRELDEDIKRKQLNSSKIFKAREVIEKLIEKCAPKLSIVKKVEDVKEDMMQSNLTDDKKRKAERVLNKVIEILKNNK